MSDSNRQPRSDCKVCSVPSDLNAIQAPKQDIVEMLTQVGFSENAIFGVKLALEEALTNAVKHGNKNDPDKTITISYAIDELRAEITITDQGAGFEPHTIPDCTEPDRLPLPFGRGLMLMKAYMDEVCYRDNGRQVYMVKNRKKK